MNHPAPQHASQRAWLIALAAGLQCTESLIPHPIPGVRLGLAQVVTLIALVDLGPAAALEIALLRTVVAALLLGTFLSTPFVLSFTAALASTLVMIALMHLVRRTPGHWLSLLGISLAGAAVHNAVQLLVAYALFVRHPGVFALWPWLGLSAVVTGALTGLIAQRACRALTTIQHPPTPAATIASAPASPPQAARWLLNLPTAAKLIPALLGLGLAVVASEPRFLAAHALGLGAILLLSRVPARPILRCLRGLAPFAIAAFLLPLFLDRHGTALASLGPLVLTAEGLTHGSTFALRLVVFGLTATWLAQTCRPEALLLALRRGLRPFAAVLPADLPEVLLLATRLVQDEWPTQARFLLSDLRGLGPRALARTLATRLATLYRNAAA